MIDEREQRDPNEICDDALFSKMKVFSRVFSYLN